MYRCPNNCAIAPGNPPFYAIWSCSVNMDAYGKLGDDQGNISLSRMDAEIQDVVCAECGEDPTWEDLP